MFCFSLIEMVHPRTFLATLPEFEDELIGAPEYQKSWWGQTYVWWA